jgi:hypothetical protein
MLNNKIKNSEFFMNNKDAGASRFVVDLKARMEAREREILVSEKSKKKIKIDMEGIYEKYEKLNFKNRLKSIKEKSNQPIVVDKEKIKKAVLKIAENSGSEILQNESRLASKYLFILSSAWPAIKNAVLIYGGRIKKIAGFSIKFFHKIFFAIGWALVYLARLVYFSGVALKNLFYFIFRNFYVGALRPIGGRVKKFVSLLVGIAGSFGRKVLSAVKTSVKNRKGIFADRQTLPHPSPEYSGQGEGVIAISEIAAKPHPIPLLAKERGSLKPTFAFAFTLILLVLPFKAFTYYKSLDLNNLRGRVIGMSEQAVGQLVLAGKSAGSMEFVAARDNFSQAAGRFVDAEKELSPISDTLLKIAGLIPNGDIKLASESKDILEAGKLAAMLGESMSVAVDGLLKSGSIGGALTNFIKYGESALAIANELGISVAGIDEKNVPEEYRDKFMAAKGSVGFMVESLNELIRLAGKGKIFMADNDFKRYLVVFQNNAEMRATGGFIGSFALLDVQNGEIKNIEIPQGGAYDTEGGFTKNIIAPEPLWLVNPLWHFWDANWWPDWPTSAEKLEWFYEKSGGPTVDGVIALTPTVLEKMLEVIGPVDMTEKYGVVITAENFWETARGVIEEKDLKYKAAGSDASDNEAKPKAIIGDLAEKILAEMPKRLDSRDKLLKLVKSFEQSLDEKHILFYFNDPELQNAAEEYGWDGELKHSSRDYLSVINSNIAGGKSDRKIKETINITAEVQEDGSIVNTLKIKREHAGLKFVDLTGVRNVDWMRIYVPLGSKFLSASGFAKPDEIYFSKPEENWIADADVLKSEVGVGVDEFSGTKMYEETGKTVFANWSMVDPGGVAEVEIKYRLPFKFQKKEPYTFGEIIKSAFNPDQKEIHVYSLLAQKQAGSESDINFNLILPKDMKIIWNYPAEFAADDYALKINDKLNTDKYWAAVLEK